MSNNCNSIGFVIIITSRENRFVVQSHFPWLPFQLMTVCPLQLWMFPMSQKSRIRPVLIKVHSLSAKMTMLEIVRNMYGYDIRTLFLPPPHLSTIRRQPVTSRCNTPRQNSCIVYHSIQIQRHVNIQVLYTTQSVCLFLSVCHTLMY